MENKIILRNKIKELRKHLDISSISDKITESISDLEIYQNSKNIMLFYPLQYEINLLKLINLNSDKKFYLPRMNCGNLECCSYCQNDKLVCKKYNILEPLTDAVDKNIIDIVFVPALCTDMNFNRLGYGGGFYDRFLSDCGSVKICPCASKFVFDEIFSEDFDVKMDLIVTEKEVLKK